MDSYLKSGGTPQDVLKNIAGVQFTVIAAILLASTFIPAGAIAFNPKLLFGEDLTGNGEPATGKEVDEQFEMVDAEKNLNMTSLDSREPRSHRQME